MVFINDKGDKIMVQMDMAYICEKGLISSAYTNICIVIRARRAPKPP